MEEFWRTLLREEPRTPAARFAGALLGSAGSAYALGVRAHRAAYRTGMVRAFRSSRPVVSVGNITLGGTGKTTFTAWLARRLLARGLQPAILSRGYGGSGSRDGAIVSDRSGILVSSDVAGDEPYMLAQQLPGTPVLVGRRRERSAVRAIERFSPALLLLDDGFQYQRLRHDLDLVLLDAEEGWGNGRVFPAGPLREDLTALKRAHLFIVTGEDAARRAELAARAAASFGHPALQFRHTVSGCRCWGEGQPESPELRGLAGFGFCAIGRPERFRRTLLDCGVELLEFRPFPDHYRWSEQEMLALGAEAVRLGAAALLTTEKDRAKMDPLLIPRLALPLITLTIDMQPVDDPAPLDSALEAVLEAGRP